MATVVTHDGTFHADEVFAVAMLQTAIEVQAVVRTRDPKRIQELRAEGAIIVDVGGQYDGAQLFDHHQQGFNKEYISGNGIPMSSFGLVWEHFGSDCVESLTGDKPTQDFLEQLYRTLVAGIDANDNGIVATDERPKYAILAPWVIVGSLNSADESKQDEQFKVAVALAQSILTQVVRSITANKNLLSTVEEGFRRAVAANAHPILQVHFDLLNLDTNRVLKDMGDDNVTFIVFPKADGFRIWTRKIGRGFELKSYLPTPEDAKKIAGDDLVFIHKGRFVAMTKTLEAAMKLCQAV